MTMLFMSTPKSYGGDADNKSHPTAPMGQLYVQRIADGMMKTKIRYHFPFYSSSFALARLYSTILEIEEKTPKLYWGQTNSTL